MKATSKILALYNPGAVTATLNSIIIQLITTETPITDNQQEDGSDLALDEHKTKATLNKLQFIKLKTKSMKNPKIEQKEQLYKQIGLIVSHSTPIILQSMSL